MDDLNDDEESVPTSAMAVADNRELTAKALVVSETGKRHVSNARAAEWGSVSTADGIDALFGSTTFRRLTGEDSLEREQARHELAEVLDSGLVVKAARKVGTDLANGAPSTTDLAMWNVGPAPSPIVLPMLIFASDDPPEPYSAPRGTCPDCGSTEVQHVVAGPFEDRSQIEDPAWVNWQPDLILYCDRECVACGLEWWCEREPLSPVRLLSDAGAGFALEPVPLLDASSQPIVDIGLLSPDRMARYLGRALASTSVAAFRDFWMKAAKHTHPEFTVPSVQEIGAGVSICVLESSAEVVTLEFTIVSDLTSDLPEHDGLAFDVSRSDLIGAALEIAEWTDEDWADEEWDQ